VHFTRATLSELFRLALPMVVSQGAFALMMFADRFFLSRLSSTHVAASMGGGVSFWVCLCFFNGLAAYSNALVAQYYGRRDLARCPQVVTQGIVLAVLAQPLLWLMALAMLRVFDLMGHDPALVALEKPYFLTFVAGAVVFLGKTVLASYFSGIGRTRVVMIADLIGVLFNIPLSYALIFGRLGLPELGIVGAALGTVLSGVLSIAIYLAFYLNPIHAERFMVTQSLAYEPALMRRYLRLGLPSALELLVGMGTFNVFLLMFQSYGVAAGAAMAIVFNWDMLCFVPLMGLNIAIMSLTGRSVGAADVVRTGEVISAGFLIAVGYAATLAVTFVVFRDPLLAVFATPGDDFSAVLAIGSPMMVGMATYLVGDALILVSGGVLRGAGDTRWLMFASMALNVVTLSAQVLVIVVWEQPPLLSWWLFVALLLSKAALFTSRLLGSRWRQPERLARVMAE
jgi:MATE family multidrug resistance protein